MADPDIIDRIWTIADRLDPCMLVTREGEGQRVRPVFARVRREEGAIYILSDTKGSKLDQIGENPNVSLAFSDARANDYVVICGMPGSATITTGRAMSGATATRLSSPRPTIPICA